MVAVFPPRFFHESRQLSPFYELYLSVNLISTKLIENSTLGTGPPFYVVIQTTQSSSHFQGGTFSSVE